MLTFTVGDMFGTPATIRVNTVNCVGVMGKGVAKWYRNHYPLQYLEYKDLCKRKALRPGVLHCCYEQSVLIVNFPTKVHWRDPSQYEWVEIGLSSLRRFLRPFGRSTTVVIPPLGCGNGGLSWGKVQSLIQSYLNNLEPDILVFRPQ